MTTRERVAVALILVGLAGVVVCAAAYGGWRAAVGAGGVLVLGCGVLLGLGDEPAAPPAVGGDTERLT